MQVHTQCILLVEDEPLIRLDLADHLRSVGTFQVLEAATGDAAVEMLQAHPEVALVITDIRTPGSIDGLKLASWLRNNRPNVNIIVLAGEAPPLSWTIGIVDLVLFKPITPKELIDDVTALLGQL